MKNLIRSIYMGCLFFVLQTPVEAATIEEVLAYCRAQTEADKRLACFDELARAVAEGEVLPNLPSSGTGQWEVSQELSPIDDSRNVYMRLEAEDEGYAAKSRPALMVRCTEGEINVFISFDSRLSYGDDKIEILSRFDQQPAKKNDWGLSTDRKAIFTPHSAAFWAIKIERAQKLFVRLTPSEENPISAIFNLAGSAEAMRPLRESCGFNVNARDQHDMTTLHWAASENALEVAELLLTHGADVNARGLLSMTALHSASLSNFLEVAELLLTHGADVNAKTTDYVLAGETALHFASSSNALEVAELLLTHGADVNAKTTGGTMAAGRTALHSASRSNALEVAGLLLTHGADVNAKDEDGGTALHSASFNNSLEVAGLLLTHGADVNAKKRGDVLTGWTALHSASWSNALEVAGLLLTHGADVNAKDEDGGTALHLAIKEGHTEMADLLRRHGGKE